ncbi:hypothetical protein DRO53_02375, partial [Candidatus Bathyarchaeota archaeon]
MEAEKTPMSLKNLDGRLKRFKRQLEKLRLEAYLCLQPANIKYFTGSPAAGELAQGLLIPLEGEATLYISRMGSLQASKEAKIGLKIREAASPEDFSRKLKTEAGRFKGLGFDDAPYSLISRLKKAGLRLAQHAEAVVKLRQVKEAWEIKAIRRAVRLAEEALAEASKYVKPGVSELEVAAAAERVLRLGGSEFYPFSTLVASGFRASYPHAEPTRKKIRDGEPVVVDLGAKVSGYCADLTR